MGSRHLLHNPHPEGSWPWRRIRHVLLLFLDGPSPSPAVALRASQLSLPSRYSAPKPAYVYGRNGADPQSQHIRMPSLTVDTGGVGSDSFQIVCLIFVGKYRNLSNDTTPSGGLDSFQLCKYIYSLTTYDRGHFLSHFINSIRSVLLHSESPWFLDVTKLFVVLFHHVFLRSFSPTRERMSDCFVDERPSFM